MKHSGKKVKAIGPECPDDKGPDDDKGKETVVDRVCPLCHTYGININLYDATNPKAKVNITIATCKNCKGLYHVDLVEDGKSI